MWKLAKSSKTQGTTENASHEWLYRNVAHLMKYLPKFSSEKRSCRKSVRIESLKARSHFPASKNLGGKGKVFTCRVLVLHDCNRILQGCGTGEIEVYDLIGEHKRKLEYPIYRNGLKETNPSVYALVKIFEDVVVAGHHDGWMHVWNVLDGKLVSSYLIGETLSNGVDWITAMARLDDTRLAVGMNSGKVLIVSHVEGTQITIEKQVGKVHCENIFSIKLIDDNRVMTCAFDPIVKVWDKNFDMCCELHNEGTVTSVAAGIKHIITVGEYSREGRIHVFSRSKLRLLQKYETNGLEIRSVTALCNRHVFNVFY